MTEVTIEVEGDGANPEEVLDIVRPLFVPSVVLLLRSADSRSRSYALGGPDRWRVSAAVVARQGTT